MAQKPDGKAAKTERVTFTRPAAERIAKVVRTVEAGDRDSAPLSFGPALANAANAKMVRAATFTGSWSIGSTNTVTFKNAPTATASVTNLSWPITHSHSSPENCIVGKEGTAWWLVVPVLQTATAVFVTQTTARSFIVSLRTAAAEIFNVLSDVTASASLNTADCTISVSLVKTTANIGIPKIETTAVTAAFNLTTTTASFVRLRVP